MKIGILGGTFDPIHLGHMLMAEITREELELDQVLFVPAGNPPHKQEQSKTPIHHRVAMVELATAPNSYFEMSAVDLERPGPHYAIDTVRLIRREHQIGRDETFFIIGGDSLRDLPKWHKPEKLIQLCRLAVIHRPGYQPEVSSLEEIIPHLPQRLTWVPMPSSGISSSELRARVKLGRSIRYQVVNAVRVYVERHQLYQKSS